VDEPDDDLSPLLWDLDAYTRGYTRKELVELAAVDLAYYDPAADVWVVKGGPYGSFEIRDADVRNASPDDYTQLAYDARFDGFTRATLDGLVENGQAEYDQQRGAWLVYGEDGPFEVRDVDAPVQRATGPAGAEVGLPPLEALIDHATVRYEAGQPPASHLEDVIFGALSAADVGDGTTAGWRDDLLRQLEAAAGQAWYEISYAGDAHPRRPIRVFDEESARRVARRMSGTGEQADVTVAASDGSRSVIGSYLNEQPLPGTAGPGDDPWPEPPPWPAGPIPAAADAAGPALPIAPGDPRATQVQFPRGISPLPVTATSGGLLRPTRLLYPDGTPVDFRPMGYNESAPAVAAGVVPATGDLAPGWLQVIQWESGNLLAVHPALISPRGVNPLGWLPYPQVRRFSEFDSAEAAGYDSVLLQAIFLEQGDRIRTAAGEIREVTAVRSLPRDDSVTVTIATIGPGAYASPQEHEGHETVEVLIPAHHPAEDSPEAGHLFAMPRPELPSYYDAGDSQDIWPGAEYNDLKATLDWIRRDGSAAGPPAAFGAADPRPDGGPAPAGMAEALQRDRSPARLPAGDATPQQAGWQASLQMTAWIHRAHSAAGAAIGSLAQNPAWLQLRSLTTSARRLAADASAGRLRFSDPAWALRSWRAVWARVCELTCDLAAGLMTDRLRGPAGHRNGSRSWRAARALHHAAAEGAAHAHGWLPRSVRLPMGSYELPGRHGRTATSRAKASAAAQGYEQAAGPGSRLEFPGGLAEVAGRAAPGGRDRQRAAAAGRRQARTRPGPARPG
jgi:hypothetical protein